MHTNKTTQGKESNKKRNKGVRRLEICSPAPIQWWSLLLAATAAAAVKRTFLLELVVGRTNESERCKTKWDLL